VRDYIHVQDLAMGHVASLRYLAGHTGATTVNLGLGRGYSVLEVLAAFEAACGRRLARTMGPRRPGDVACYYADPGRAAELLGWRAERNLEAICVDAWRWHRNRAR
jgi:UDP-glucose 4-epimerase